MSANKTIKALREERTQLYAEIRRLQGFSEVSPLAASIRAGIISVPATSLTELKVQPGRVDISFALDDLPENFKQEFWRIQGVDPAAPGTDSTVRTTFQGGQVVDVQPVDLLVAPWQSAPEEATHGLLTANGWRWYKIDQSTGSVQFFGMAIPAWFIDQPVAHQVEGFLASLIERPAVKTPEQCPAPDEAWSQKDLDGYWNYDSLHEMIRDTYDPAFPDEMKPGIVVYRAKKRLDDPATYVPDANDVVERMNERACESDGGEYADNYPDLKDDAMAALEVALEPLQDWARKYAPPGHFTVCEIQPYTVTEEDIKAATTAQAGAQ